MRRLKSVTFGASFPEQCYLPPSVETATFLDCEGMVDLPQCLAACQHLRTLVISNALEMTILPKALEQFLELRFLEIKGTPHLTATAANLAALHHLHTVRLESATPEPLAKALPPWAAVKRCRSLF